MARQQQNQQGLLRIHFLIGAMVAVALLESKANYDPLNSDFKVSDSLSFKSLTGEYLLLQDYPSIERCDYGILKLKSSGKFVLIDDELPGNMKEIPNTSKVFGRYKISNDSTIILHSEYIRYKFTLRSSGKNTVKEEQKQEFQFLVKGDTLVRTDFPFNHIGGRSCSFVKD